MNFIHVCVMSFGGVELELWLSFNYITTNVVLACVMSLKKGMELKFFDYYSIILYPMEHWHMSHGHSWSTIKLNYLMCAMYCMVSKSWNDWFIENVNIWYCAMWTLMLHTCMAHGILLFVGHPTYMKLSKSKEFNYKVVESKLKRNWKYVEKKSKFM